MAASNALVERGTALDLLFGEESEEALDLIDPGR
jgi:hypothetical protein